jgi:hypothetical protein
MQYFGSGNADLRLSKISHTFMATIKGARTK